MVRVAVVGLGRMGVLHGSLLSRIPGTALVGVMDANGNRERFVKSAGILCPFYISLEALLREARPDAVFICVPPCFTLGLAERCRRSGLAIFVEKPMADSLESAARLLDVEMKHAGPPCTVGYVTAHMATFRRARELLASAALGPVRSVSASISIGAVFSRLHSWMGSWKMAGGGAVAQVGSHLLYTLYRLFGPVREVRTTLEHRRNAVEDGAHIALVFEPSIAADVRVAWDVEAYPTHHLLIHIRGDLGQLTVSNRELRLLARHGGAEHVTVLHAANFPDHAPFYLGGEGYCEEDLEFISCVITSERPTVSWQDGYAVQQILDAVYRSAHEGTIAVPQGCP